MKYSLLPFRTLLPIAVIACVALTSLPAANAGIVFSQIPEPFATESYQGGTYGVSQNDIGAAGTIFRENYSTSFDNFSFANDLTVTRFQWAGGYELINADGSTTASANSFTIGVYANDTTSGMSEPGTQLYSFDVGLASESKIAGVPGFYEYSAYVSPFAVTGGETYWFSVVANLDYLNNEWGLGYSDLGDDVSFQDIGQFAADPLTRVKDSVDYAFSVTAVPEPSTFVCFASMGLVIALRRRRGSTSTPKMRLA